ncbi:LPS export ABC transporter periplasmic protein LptC [Allosphingosinicella flava]|uniref:LPS export ABC transporter periplasmic protein LptC n=1 Tax=Allosphingosinicella flava TaxID=2771430 RepID=A0A7T2LM15_9SPHN|nr:LPS export ABC transporter periplasmic protein LptC [Sphingosinicella flava]QPQ54607.1 LPS export ABC transporter periplasmic protein LptC [Sphingosinicella flava]
MSEAATRERTVKRHWAVPGSAHDRFVGILKIALPTLIGMLVAYLALAPLTRGEEFSFLLDKNEVAVAEERMRVLSAQYRGQDSKGRPFVIGADSAIQATSADPIVDINGMAARMLLENGPATLTASKARYNLEEETVAVNGPVRFAAADGYRLETRDVQVDLDTRTMHGDNGVSGEMPLGSFSADTMSADLGSRTVTLAGRARLHIEQGAAR